MTMYERIVTTHAAKIKAQWSELPAASEMTPMTEQFFVELAIEAIDEMSNTDFLQLLSDDDAK